MRMSTRKRVLLLAAAFVAAAHRPASAQVVQDHLTCFKTRDPAKVKYALDLVAIHRPRERPLVDETLEATLSGALVGRGQSSAQPRGRCVDGGGNPFRRGAGSFGCFPRRQTRGANLGRCGGGRTESRRGATRGRGAVGRAARRCRRRLSADRQPRPSRRATRAERSACASRLSTRPPEAAAQGGARAPKAGGRAATAGRGGGRQNGTRISASRNIHAIIRKTSLKASARA